MAGDCGDFEKICTYRNSPLVQSCFHVAVKRLISHVIVTVIQKGKNVLLFGVHYFSHFLKLIMCNFNAWQLMIAFNTDP